MKPIVDELKEKYQEEVDFKIIDINSTEGQEKASKYGVSYIPTFVFQKTNSEINEKIVGPMSKEAFEVRIIELKEN